MMRSAGGKENFEHVMMCLICRSIFDDHEHQPKFLPCHHTFCKECLRQFVRQTGDEIECPSCRKVATIPAAGVAALQTNFYAKYIQNLVYGSSGSSVGWDVDCQQHPKHRLLHFCKDCVVSVCDVCMEERGCVGHRQDLLTVVMEKCRCDIDTAFSDTNLLIENKKVELEGMLKTLAEEKDRALIKIESTFERHIHALTRRATLLKNKVIDIYNEGATKLDGDLEEIATGMTCIVSLKDHYELMIARGEFPDTWISPTEGFSQRGEFPDVGIEELREVHQNLSERIQPKVGHISFEDKHGVEVFHNCVKDLGRVVSVSSDLQNVKQTVDDPVLQSPRSDSELVPSPEVGAVSDCDDSGTDSGGSKHRSVQHVLCLTGFQNPQWNSPPSSFKTEMSVNIQSCVVNVENDRAPNNNPNPNPSTGQKQKSAEIEKHKIVKLDSKSDSSILAHAFVSENSSINKMHTMSNEKPSDAVKMHTSVANVNNEKPSDAVKTHTSVANVNNEKPSDAVKTHTSVANVNNEKPSDAGVTSSAISLEQEVIFKVKYLPDDRTNERKSKEQPCSNTSRAFNMETAKETSARVQNRSSLASTVVAVQNHPTFSGARTGRDSDETVTPWKTDPALRFAAHKSYEEPQLRVELGYETSDVDDGNITPSRQMSRSDFWLMMSSSIESNLSDHDLIVAELSGEQTSL